MFERNVQCDIRYRICKLAYRTAGQLLDVHVICCDVCTADRKLDIGYVDSYRMAGPRMMLAHK